MVALKGNGMKGEVVALARFSNFMNQNFRFSDDLKKNLKNKFYYKYILLN